MKKLLSIVFVALFVSINAFAQDANEIFAKYEGLTKAAEFKSTLDGRSSLCEMEFAAGPMSMPYKAVAKYPGKFRVDMNVQGTNILVVITDGKAYVTANGQTEVVEDPAQVQQIVPMTDFASDMAPIAADYTDLTFVGTEGKGKKECYMVEGVDAEDGSKTKFFFNVKSGLLTKMIGYVMMQDGTTFELVLRLEKYKEFADGELYLPSKLITETPEGDISISILNFEMDYPTAPWMFAAPKM